MTKKKLNILYLVPGFSSSESVTNFLPYLEVYIKHMAMQHSHNRYCILSFHYPYPSGIYLWNNLKVYSAGGRQRKHIFRILTWLHVFFLFFKIHSEEKVDIIHSFWLTECTLIGQYLSNLFDIKQIASIMGQDVLENNRYLRLLNFKNTMLTACSDFAASKFSFTRQKKTDAVIPWGLDQGLFESYRNDQPRQIDIIGIGALSTVKNFTLFIDILHEITKEHRHLKAVIIGEGHQRPLLEKRISDLKLEDTIYLTGLLSRTKVIEYLFQSKILLHTAQFEGMGYAIAEALHAGLNVISFEVGHNYRTSKAVRCRSVPEIIDQLKRLLESRLDFNPVSTCSVTDTVTSFEKIYQQLSQ
ncbi:glycosyltransferase [bacterium]|nr:glycosyltransferase [bacterium]